jgi:hypothetical protein
MAKKKRDYKAEYRRRIANAKKRGFSISQARGHPKPGEKPLSKKRIKSDAGLERALRFLSEFGVQKTAAEKAGVSVKRFRRFLYANKLASRKGRKWKVHDHRVKQMTSFVDGRTAVLKLKGEQASINGRFMAAVGQFLDTNNYGFVEPYVGVSVRDTSGKRHVFETSPNTLYRLSSAQDEPFEQNYRIIA